MLPKHELVKLDEEQIGAITEWLQHGQVHSCPHIRCQMCMKIFPYIESKPYSYHCPCANYTFDYVRAVAKKVLKYNGVVYEESTNRRKSRPA